MSTRGMDDLSDRDLRDALVSPDLDERERAYARELLRRRYETRPNAYRQRSHLLGGFAKARINHG